MRPPPCSVIRWLARLLTPDHSIDESRFVTIGQSAEGRLVVVVHADREEDVRIITARCAMAGEKRKHAEDQG